MDIRIIDHDKGIRLTTGQRVAHMMAKGYNYGNHCLPHDAGSLRPGGLTFVEELSNAGLNNVMIIPRTTDPERRINRMMELFPNIWFNKPKTEGLLESLEAYHRKIDQKTATVENRVVHDWASHDADAFGYISEAEQAGMIPRNQARLGKGGNVEVTKGVRLVPDEDFPEEKVRVERKVQYNKIRVKR